jgi:hypothetical protein
MRQETLQHRVVNNHRRGSPIWQPPLRTGADALEFHPIVVEENRKQMPFSPARRRRRESNEKCKRLKPRW